MSDFLSINPAPDTVTINGKKIGVHGISMEGFGNLIPRFPNLMTELQERLNADGKLTVVAVMQVAGHAIGPILAAGVGHPGNEQAEKDLARLSAAYQLKLLDKIIEKTMPDGIGPFVDQWANMMARFAPPTPRKMRFKVLQRESKPSSESADTAKAMSGA
jgi:hypothetical protein